MQRSTWGCSLPCSPPPWEDAAGSQQPIRAHQPQQHVSQSPSMSFVPSYWCMPHPTPARWLQAAPGPLQQRQSAAFIAPPALLSHHLLFPTPPSFTTPTNPPCRNLPVPAAKITPDLLQDQTQQSPPPPSATPPDNPNPCAVGRPPSPRCTVGWGFPTRPAGGCVSLCSFSAHL